MKKVLFFIATIGTLVSCSKTEQINDITPVLATSNEPVTAKEKAEQGLTLVTSVPLNNNKKMYIYEVNEAVAVKAVPGTDAATCPRSIPQTIGATVWATPPLPFGSYILHFDLVYTSPITGVLKIRFRLANNQLMVAYVPVDPSPYGELSDIAIPLAASAFGVKLVDIVGSANIQGCAYSTYYTQFAGTVIALPQP